MKTIRGKLVLSFSLLMVLSALIVISGYYSLLKLSEGDELVSRINSIRVNGMAIKGLQQQFLLEDARDTAFYLSNSSASLEQASVHIENIKEEIKTIYTSFSGIGEIRNDLSLLEECLDTYQAQFAQLVKLQRNTGFKNWGTIGQLRKAIHQIENDTLAYNPAFMLMLRRHEKDFLLRKDLKYLSRFQQGIADFSEHIYNNPDISQADREKLLASLQTYQQLFEQVVQQEQLTGFTHSQGLKKELFKLLETSEATIVALIHSASYVREEKVNIAIWQFTGFFSGQLLMGAIFALQFSGRLAGRIRRLKAAINQMANGQAVENLQVKGTDELSSLAESVQKLNSRIKTAVTFANTIGQGNLAAVYPEKYRNGMLEQALTRMHQDLVKANNDRTNQNWIASGIGRINEVFRQQHQGLEECSSQLVSEMVKYLKAQMGGLFLLKQQEQDTYLELTACYAYSSNRHREKRVAPGHGLLGQTCLDGEPLYITDIPKDYFTVFSGLGNVQPACLFLIPLVFNEETVGVIEIASLARLQEHEQQYCTKAAEVIAYFLLNYDRANEEEGHKKTGGENLRHANVNI